MKKILIINPADNTGIALEDIAPGTEIEAGISNTSYKVTAKEIIPFGFKIALREIPRGSVVVKYGEVIGEAVRDISAGECVHIHNVAGKRA